MPGSRLYYDWSDELLEGGKAALAGKEERRQGRDLPHPLVEPIGVWAERQLAGQR